MAQRAWTDPAEMRVPPVSERLRVAYVADTIEGKLGGGVVAARNVVASLRERHDVVTIAADGDVRMPGFTLPLHAMQSMEFVMARPDRAALRGAIEAADVVHLQFPFWLSIAAVTEAKQAGVPVVAAFHVQPENVLLNIGVRSEWLSRQIYAHWVARVFNRADAVVCPTPFAQRRLREHGLVAPSVVISNGVPPDVKPARVAREPVHEGKFLILAVGRLAGEKRQDVILEAVRRSAHRDRIALVLAGAGPWEEELRAQAEGIPVDVEMGFLPRERLLRLLNTADLMVHASEVELEGIAVLEALRVGLPVVIAKAPESAASELALGDDFAFPAGDADALAARIDALVEHPLRLTHARSRALAASRAFSFDAGVATLEALYQRLRFERRFGSKPAE
jgi:glycosyltransferase involved in cell wall biosynthesis